jgi:hypothetical protein
MKYSKPHVYYIRFGKSMIHEYENKTKQCKSFTKSEAAGKEE